MTQRFITLYGIDIDNDYYPTTQQYYLLEKNADASHNPYMDRFETDICDDPIDFTEEIHIVQMRKRSYGDPDRIYKAFFSMENAQQFAEDFKNQYPEYSLYHIKTEGIEDAEEAFGWKLHKVLVPVWGFLEFQVRAKDWDMLVERTKERFTRCYNIHDKESAIDHDPYHWQLEEID